MKNLSVVLFICVSLLVSCVKKDFKPNIETTVSGRAYDSINNEPYQGLSLKIGEYQQSSYFSGYRIYLVDTRDSAVTDANGNYSMKFTTTGKGDYYYLTFDHLKSHVLSVQNKNITYPYRTISINNIGLSNKIDFNVWHQYYMKTRIIFKNNPYPPLKMNLGDAQFPFSGYPATIYGKSNDTTLYIVVMKSVPSPTVYFSIIDPATGKQLLNTLIPFNITIDKDTIQGPTFSVDPRTFH